MLDAGVVDGADEVDSIADTPDSDPVNSIQVPTGGTHRPRQSASATATTKGSVPSLIARTVNEVPRQTPTAGTLSIIASVTFFHLVDI